LGDDYEDARIELKNPGGFKKKAPASESQKPASKAGGKRKRDEDDEDDKDASPKKKPTGSRASPRKKRDDNDDDRVSPALKFSGVLLAQSYKVDGNVNPAGWWLSEKLDGVR